MEQGKTPLDIYSEKVGNPQKPKTKKGVLHRFNELLNAKDDDFLRGITYSKVISEEEGNEIIEEDQVLTTSDEEK